jgi:hypothetical protein
MYERRMQRFLAIVGFCLAAGTAYAQQQSPSAFYPAPPPEKAPEVDQGAPVGNLSSPLAGDKAPITRTTVDSEAEAQLFTNAGKIVWGRYSKIKGAKPGTVSRGKGFASWRTSMHSPDSTQQKSTSSLLRNDTPHAPEA